MSNENVNESTYFLTNKPSKETKTPVFKHSVYINMLFLQGEKDTHRRVWQHSKHGQKRGAQTSRDKIDRAVSSLGAANPSTKQPSLR